MICKILALFGIAYSILLSILWTVFTVKMSTIIWNIKKFKKLIAINLLFTPLSILLWITNGSEVVRRRLIVAKEIMEFKTKKKNKKEK